MTAPINPNDPSQIPPTSAPIGAPDVGNFFSQSNIDPTGIWTKFLSTPGNPATPNDVKKFIQGLLKSFGVLIQQNQKAMERARREMKKAERGE